MESCSATIGSRGTGGSIGGVSSKMMSFSLDANILREDEYVACFQDTEGGNSGVTADPIERIEERIASLETMLTVECKKWARAAEGNKIRGT
ncbi:hypothetical protein PIB30_076261, partial [Stylosanthes scabra]|nr:hypothetical protein [Stylosanthes scabra]